MKFVFRISLLLCLAFHTCGCGASRGSIVPETDKAPAFELADRDGNRVSRSGLEGRYVLLHFWATWCGSCVQELASLENIHRLYDSKGLSVVAITIDSEEAALQDLLATHRVSFPVLYDGKGAVRDAYDVSGVPQTFLISPDGRMARIKDPQNGALLPFIVGPRDWDDPLTSLYFAELVRR
jgi:peroxiredoxin